MNFGFRIPSLKKSISAATKGQLTRAAKEITNPLYGQKGMGFINDPKRAMYNAVYNQTTFGINDLVDSPPNTASRFKAPSADNIKIYYETREEIRKNAENMIFTLKSFNVSAKLLMVEQGATVTTYYIQPAKGIKISDIEQLKDDIALHLHTSKVNIVPNFQKGAIGIEVENRTFF